MFQSVYVLISRFFVVVGTDYVAFDPVRLLYRGGNRQEDIVTFFIEIIDDDIVETLRESFEIVGVATRNLYFPFPVMTVTIIDNDGVGMCIQNW